MACEVFVHFDGVYDLNNHFYEGFAGFHRIRPRKWTNLDEFHPQRPEWIGILPGVDLKDRFLDRQTLTDICRTKAASRFALLISQLFL